MRLLLSFSISFFLCQGLFATEVSTHHHDVPAHPTQKRIEQPEACFPKHKPCALRFIEQTKIEIDGEELHFMAGSSILILDYRKWQLIEGGLWAPKLSGAEIRFGETRFFAAGGIYLRREKAEMIARNLDGQLRVHYPNADEKELPTGFENRFGLLNADLSLDEGIVRAIEAKKFVPDWLKTAILTPEERELYFTSYRRIHGFAVVEAGLLYKQAFVLRETAALEKEREAAEAAARVKKDQDAIRKIFRDRYFEPPELRGVTLD